MDTLHRERPLVAVINTTQESIELLEKALADQGFATISALIIDFKRGLRDLEAFFEEHRPQAVIWDIALPYIENWRFFQDQVLNRQLIPERCVVVTTANRTVLDMLVGPTPAYELIGRPLDLQAIVGAVKQAVSGEA